MMFTQQAESGSSAALDTIQIMVNGGTRHVSPGLSVGALLAVLELPADRVAVELDKSIVRKRDWAETTIRPGARVEIVEFVGGG